MAHLSAGSIAPQYGWTSPWTGAGFRAFGCMLERLQAVPKPSVRGLDTGSPVRWRAASDRVSGQQFTTLSALQPSRLSRILLHRIS